MNIGVHRPANSIPARSSKPSVNFRQIGHPRPLKQRYDWRNYDMTLCVAAACHVGGFGDERIVVGFDWRVETQIAGADTEFKFQRLSDHWVALIAGNVAQAHELAGLYREYLTPRQSEITLDNVLDHLRTPPRTLRRSLADIYTHAKLSLSYDDFLSTGKSRLPEDYYRQLLFDISAQTIDVELILIGDVFGSLHIFEYSNLEVQKREDFAAIGSGRYIAEAALYQREHQSARDLPTTVYSVYEAMRLGSIAPGVGRELSVMVLRREKSYYRTMSYP